MYIYLYFGARCGLIGRCLVYFFLFGFGCVLENSIDLRSGLRLRRVCVGGICWSCVESCFLVILYAVDGYFFSRFSRARFSLFRLPSCSPVSLVLSSLPLRNVINEYHKSAKKYAIKSAIPTSSRSIPKKAT